MGIREVRGVDSIVAILMDEVVPNTTGHREDKVADSIRANMGINQSSLVYRMGAPMDISMVHSTEDTMELMVGRVVGSSSNIVNMVNKQGFQLSTDLRVGYAAVAPYSIKKNKICLSSFNSTGFGIAAQQYVVT